MWLLVAVSAVWWCVHCAVVSVLAAAAVSDTVSRSNATVGLVDHSARDARSVNAAPEIGSVGPLGALYRRPSVAVSL